jgi:hypothetical protein
MCANRPSIPERDDMKKGKRTEKMKKPYAKLSQPAAGGAPPAQQVIPKTYSLVPVGDSGEEGMVEMTSRELFEINCPGIDPAFYDGLDETTIYAKMFDRADRLAVMKGKWHPDDVSKVAMACTDFVLDSLRRNLDMRQLKDGKQPTQTHLKK